MGIGGAGMRALAWFLFELGAEVSGSDISKSNHTEFMEEAGMRIYEGHHSKHIPDHLDYLVASTAINKDNSEYQAALLCGATVLTRAQMLERLVQGTTQQIAIAGTHGKTSTTAILVQLYESLGLDPNYFIGSEIEGQEKNMRFHQSDTFIFETDESDGSFLEFSPSDCIISNIEEEHMAFFKTRDVLLDHFYRFIDQTSGFVCVNLDDTHLLEWASSTSRKFVSYAIQNDSAKYVAKNIRFNQDGVIFSVYQSGQSLGDIFSPLMGIHNVYNLLSALAFCLEKEMSFSALLGASRHLKTTARRVEKVFEDDVITIYDDYAHHPTEIDTTLAGLRRRVQGRLIAIFQPHRYSRTLDLLDEFSKCFSQADWVLLTDIYSAAENPKDFPVTIHQVYEKLKQQHAQVLYCSDFDSITSCIQDMSQEGDVFVTMGAGNITHFAKHFKSNILASQKG